MQPRLTLDEFIARSKQAHGDFYDYSRVRYTTVKTPVEIICPKHGPFLQAPEQHMLGRGCKECAKEKRKATMLARHGVEYASQSADMQAKSRATREAKFGGMKPPGSGRKAMGTEEFVRRAREVHGDRYDYSQVEYVDNGTKVKIGCPVHGTFEQIPAKHLQGRGCPHPECIAEKKAEALERRAAEGRPGKLGKDGFVRRAMAVHGDFYDYSRVEYKNTKTKVEIVCPIHGPFLQAPEKHMAGAGCPHPECVKHRTEATNQARYGVARPMQSETVREKARESSRARYGTDNMMQSDTGKARMAEACRKKFGTDSPLASPEVREKIVATDTEKYGGASPFCSEEVKSKSMATNMARRDVPNPMMDAAVKAKQRETVATRYGVDNPMHVAPIKKKVVETKAANGTFNSSDAEEVLYGMLVERFGMADVVRQYASDAYPYACDFYVRSRNLYIELNGTWTHAGHWYHADPDDRATAAEWTAKAAENPYYASAVGTWTSSDPAKRAAARMAGLDYVVFWGHSLDDARLWFAMDCPDGRDWEREYSWIPARRFRGVEMPFPKETPNSQVTSQIMKHYQFRTFYAKELAMWERNPVYHGMPLQGFLYANRYKYTGKLPGELSDLQLVRGFTIAGILKSYTVFDTEAMDGAVAKHGIKSVYDPCAGWGERMLYCHFHGIPYHGVDVNRALEPGYRAMMADFKIHSDAFQVADSSWYVPVCKADAVVTCPPYGDTEVYGPDGAENLDADGFLAWWEATVRNCLAAEPRLFCFQVNRKWRDPMLGIVEKAGFRSIDEVFCRKRSSNMTRGRDGMDRKRGHESMLVLERF